MEQKTAVKKLLIYIYGAKRTLDRPRQGSPDDALWGTPRADTAGVSSPKPSDDHYTSLGQCGTLQAANMSPPTNVLSHFGLILGPFAI